VSAIPLRRIEGKYEILEKLGEGGMGAVYKVRHRLLDDVRVIKMMRPQLVADEEFKARFQREARVAIQLRHPNIAHLIDFTIDEEDGTAFIVMELIDGMTLEEVLRHSGPPPLGLALEIGQQALRALGCLHERGFVHRDISPDNLMLTADAEGRPLVKLIDLGIAKVLGTGAGTDLSTGGGHLTGTGIFLGKVRYSSPEQFGTEGAAMVDARGDLYSLGVVLYELLTGRYPIQGRDPSSLIAGHLFRPPLDFADSDPGGRVRPELRALLLRALAKEPAQRFASAREIGAALAELRAPGDVADGDLRRALTRLPGGTVRVPVTPPGSTQDRLNAQFGLRTTPSSHGGDGGKAAPPPARRSPEVELRVRTLLREAESLLERNDYEGALAHLERGKALAPGNAEVQVLLDKAELAVRARRRTRDLTGVQEEIEAALARRDYRAAEMRLYQAEASFGEQEVFTRLHERLGELRRVDLEARRRAERLMAVIQGIETAFAAGDLAGALEEARQALELDPESARAKALAEGITVELARREEAEAAAQEAARLAEIAAQEAARRAEIEAEEAARQAELEAQEAAHQQEIAAEEAARQAELEAQEAARRAEVEAEEAAHRVELEEAARIEAEALRRREEAELAAIRAERRRREKEAERAEQLAAAVAAIDACLDGGDPEGAARLLPGIASIFGDAPALRERWERVEALRHRQELESALAAIDEELERKDLAAAARRLPAAVARFGGEAALRERWERLEALQRAARVEALRTEAASLVRAGHLDRAARKLRQALELDPADPRTAEQLAALARG
jgi:serine/threonine protein kinase